MIANNIFRAIGDFFTNVLFVPYDHFRFMDGWWPSNIINNIIILITFIAAFYWLSVMVRHQRENSL